MRLLFLSSTLEGGLRCPVILVNQRWASVSRVIGSGVRWVAVEVASMLGFISAHLPHCGLGILEYIACLDELRTFVSTLKDYRVCFGLDANTEVHGIVDMLHVGQGVRQRQGRDLCSDRAVLLHEFLGEWAIYLANTFVHEPNSDDYLTRYNWSGAGSGAQIDFIGLPLHCKCTDAGVDQWMVFSSDHRYVWATVVGQLTRTADARQPAPRNWRPAHSWKTMSAQLTWNWNEWPTMTSSWRDAAVSHALKTPKGKDEVLRELLWCARVESSTTAEIAKQTYLAV